MARKKIAFIGAGNVGATCAHLCFLRGLGEILLLRAERPLRRPVEGVRRRGNTLAQRFYRWYMRKIGKERLREGYEPV